MNPLKILWQFSRPHTIVGSALSILSIFAIAAGTSPGAFIHPLLLPFSLLSALACNIYITGLNQWSDVEVDKINKPWLPIAAGVLSPNAAFGIVWVCGALALLAAVCLSWPFFGLISSIMVIGTAYSLPPLKFKRNHILAASAIALVRGLMVNLGFYLHFRYEMTGDWALTPEIWPLTVFVAAFSLGIAWFKDIPDTAGDAAYKFGTLAVKSGRRRAFLAGVWVVSLAYAYVISAAAMGQLPVPLFYIATHSAALLFFLWLARSLQVSDNRQVKQFYLFFWGLFFLEYVVYPIGFWWPA